MKMKKSVTSKSGGTKVLLEVISVSIPDAYTESQSSAETFLREAGFVSISRSGGHVTAVAPISRKDGVFVIEYESHPEKAFKPCRLVHISGGRPKDIDSGRVQFIVPGEGAESEITIEGEEVSHWEIKAMESSISVIPESGAFCAGDGNAADRSNERTPLSKINDDCSVPGHIEMPLPSTAEAMIGYILETRKAIASTAPIVPFKRALKKATVPPTEPASQSAEAQPKGKSEYAVSSNTVERFTVKAAPIPTYMPKSACLKPVWQTSRCIIDYMDKHCGGSRSAFDLSKAIRRQLKAGRNKGEIARELREYSAFVSAIGSVDKLEPALRPLLELPSDNRDRITMEILKVLVKFPMSAQVDAWNIAKKPRQPNKKKTSKEMIDRLYELGAIYFQRRGRISSAFQKIVGSGTHS